MISEGSCDIEDWSSDAENYILKYIETFIKNFNYFTMLLISVFTVL